MLDLAKTAEYGVSILVIIALFMTIWKIMAMNSKELKEHHRRSDKIQDKYQENMDKVSRSLDDLHISVRVQNETLQTLLRNTLSHVHNHPKDS